MTEIAAISQPNPRRAQILAQAIELFDSHGYRGTTIDALGEACGITGPAVYRHFGNKAALLEAVFNDTMGYILAEWREIVQQPSQDARATIDRMIVFHVDYVLDHRALMRIVRNEVRHLPSGSLDSFRKKQSAYLDLLADRVRKLRSWDDVAGSRVVSFGVLNLVNAFSQRQNQMSRPQLDGLLRDMAWAILDGKLETGQSASLAAME